MDRNPFSGLGWLRCRFIFLLAMGLMGIHLHAESNAIGNDEYDPRVPVWDSSRWGVHADTGKDLRLLTGSFRVTSTLFAHPIIRCDYLIPSTDGTVPCSSASDIVLFFPYPGQVVKDFGPAQALAAHYGFSVLSLYFSNFSAAEQDDLKRYYIYPASGSGTAWMTALSGLRLIARFPVRKVFTVGYSAGASAAQQFSSTFAASVEAAVFAGGRTFITDPPFLGPAILMHSDLDRQEANSALEKSMKTGGALPIHVTYPPDWTGRGSNAYWFHNVDGRGWQLGSHWLSLVANLRAKNAGVLPNANTWPRHAGFAVPAIELKNDIDAMPKSPETLTDPRQETLGLIVTPPQQVPPTGSAFIIDHRFGSDQNELMAISQTLNSHGLSVLAQSGPVDRSQDLVAMINSRMTNSGIYVKPTVLIIIAPSHEDIEIFKSVHRIDRIALIEPGIVEMESLFSYFRDCGVRSHVLATKNLNDRCIPLFPSTRFFTANIPDYGYKNIGERYRGWTDFILKAYADK